MKAIVYTSNTGHTKAYAEMLAEKTGLPVYELETAKGELEKGSEIIFLGWLMAGNVKGYKKARKLFSVAAVCGVGMAPSGTQIDDIKKTNGVPDGTRIFCVQGGFEMEKLTGVYKMMMKTMFKFVGRKIENKKDEATEQDLYMLDMIKNGRSITEEENLAPLLAWYKGE